MNLRLARTVMDIMMTDLTVGLLLMQVMTIETTHGGTRLTMLLTKSKI